MLDRGKDKNWLAKDFLFFSFLFNRLCVYVLCYPELLTEKSWHISCGKLEGDIFFSLQEELAMILQEVLSGEFQNSLCHQVLEKVAECGDIHILYIVESMAHVISYLPRDLRGAKWGVLITSYLSLDIWLRGKMKQEVERNNSEIQREELRIISSLSENPSCLCILGYQSGFLGQKIPDRILEPVMNGLAHVEYEANLHLSDVQQILNSFATIPESFRQIILHNKRSMLESLFLSHSSQQ
jgi:hypothetical protein